MIQLDWYIPDTVPYVKLTGNVTEKDITIRDRTLSRVLDEAQSDKIYLMLDFSGLMSLPSITDMVKLRWAKHPKLDKIIVIGSREPFTLTASIVGQLFRKEVVFVDNIYQTHYYLMSISQQVTDEISVSSAFN